mmetsp:Transcript_80748/g.237302  ORF Transcript_80748/g.237302 Transcript_80748/m.237302 type:complete len:116 (+) Transcript_80748:163-510(+)
MSPARGARSTGQVLRCWVRRRTSGVKLSDPTVEAEAGVASGTKLNDPIVETETGEASGTKLSDPLAETETGEAISMSRLSRQGVPRQTGKASQDKAAAIVQCRLVRRARSHRGLL